jgi:CHAT domain-containing protein
MGFSDLGYFYWYGKADYKKSLEYYHKAVFELVHTRAPDNYYQMPDINKSFGDKELARELGNKGECFYEVSHLCKTKAETILDLKASLDNLELSEIVAHRYKMSLSSDEQRYQYADGIQHRYPYIINVCIVLYSQTGDTNYARKAFEYSEKSKSSMLLSTMRGVNAHNMHLLPDDLKNAEDRIWTKTELVSQYLKESYNAANVNRAKIDEYNTKLVILRSQQDSLLRIFKQKYSAYYNARYNDNVITADSLQKLLKPNEAALEYTVSSKNIVIYMVTRNEFKVFTDTIGPGFFADIEAYRQQLSDYTYDYRDSVIRNYALLANRLYKRLVKPAESYIKGKKILIIPDDVLTQIPFETLVTQPVPDKVQSSFRTMAYLVKEHVVYYNYSGTLYAMNRGTHVYPHAKLLAVAPKYENKTSYQQGVRDTSHTDSTSLLPIPWALDEVKEIHKLFGGKILSKGSATEQHFKEIAGKYDILHLAAHGLVNNNYPMFSKLVFTGDKDSTNEGYLNTYEIYNMHINAPLVVLSACNSGYGKLHKGEGIISLARGFFTAGAKSIVMTLWAVSDKSSSQIVKNFYGSLSSNQNIGEAMQKSKIQYLEQTDEEGAHPYFWSGYIVLGNAGSSFEPISPTYYYILWATGGFIIFMLWVMRKKIWLKFSTFWEYSRF